LGRNQSSGTADSLQANKILLGCGWSDLPRKRAAAQPELPLTLPPASPQNRANSLAAFVALPLTGIVWK